MSEFTFKNVVSVEDNDNDKSGTATVVWNFEISAREWGVKDFCIFVPPQTIEVVWTAEWDAEGEKDPVVESIQIDECKTYCAIEFGRALCADSLERSKGKWTLTF